MSLVNLMKAATEKYDPTTSPNAPEQVPPGEYDVFVEKCGYRVFEKSGWDCISIEVTILDEEYANRKELININVDPDNDTYQQYPGLLTNAIRLLTQYSFATGCETTDDDWENQMTLGQALGSTVGAQCVLKITETVGKKDPSKRYRNYEFLKYAEAF